MAEYKRYVIEIKGESSSGGPLAEAKHRGSKAKEKDPLNVLQRLMASPGQLLHSSLLSSQEKKFKNGDFASKYEASMSAVGIQLASAVANQATNFAQMGTNRYLSLTEDYMAKNTLNNINVAINKTKSAANSMISGAMSLSAFGGVPMVAGAVIGGLSWGISQYGEYQQRMSNYYQALNATNFQTEFSASKLGLNNDGRGTEN